MPGYKKMTVASLRDVCESRGLQCSGLRKSELIDLLRRDDDAREVESDNDDSNEGHDSDLNGEDEDDNEVSLGGQFVNGGHATATIPDAMLAGGEEGESESIKEHRLKLALVQAESEARERSWAIEQERILLQGGTTGLAQQLSG